MKAREQRRKVMIAGRVRAGAVWADTCIVNLSSRGLGLQSADPPPRGTYVEVRRGPHLIVAQVIWTEGHQFGVRTQDPLTIDAVISRSADPGAAAVDVAADWPKRERRRQRRHEDRHQKSKQLASRMQFAGVAVAAVVGALLLFGTVEQAFAKSLSVVSAALHRG